MGPTNGETRGRDRNKVNYCICAIGAAWILPVCGEETAQTASWLVYWTTGQGGHAVWSATLWVCECVYVPFFFFFFFKERGFNWGRCGSRPCNYSHLGRRSKRRNKFSQNRGEKWWWWGHWPWSRLLLVCLLPHGFEMRVHTFGTFGLFPPQNTLGPLPVSLQRTCLSESDFTVKPNE